MDDEVQDGPPRTPVALTWRHDHWLIECRRQVVRAPIRYGYGDRDAVERWAAEYLRDTKADR